MDSNNEKTVVITDEKTLNVSKADVFFAWCSFLLGFLFCRAFPVINNSLGGFLLTVAAFVVTFIILCVKKIKMPPAAIISALSALLISAALILSGSKILSFLAYFYVMVSYCYFVYASTGNKLEKGFSDCVLFDYLKAIFIMPFCSLGEIFKTIASRKTKSSLKVFVKLICGLAIAAVPTLVVTALLSYDEGFTKILNKLFSFDFFDVFSWLFSAIFAIPLGMYIFGLFHSSVEGKSKKIITANGCQKGLNNVRILPQLTALTATLPILFIYVIYFISQWKYYVSGFTGVLPREFSYAQYAREGFFQLCAVAVINLLIILTIMLFMKRSSGKNSVISKILSVILCVFTLVLISTAVAKLVMYIKIYGLTQKRVYALWLMAVIALIYIVIALGQFISKIKATTVCLAIIVIMFASLSLCNVNKIIAEYNVNRYISGDLTQEVDVQALDKLGDAAVPALVRLEEHLSQKTDSEPGSDSRLKRLTEMYLKRNAEDFKERENDSVFSFTIPAYQAKVALIKGGWLEDK